MITEMKVSKTRSKTSSKHDPQSREVMKIFYLRNKALNWKRKDYWEACDALIKAYGLSTINSKMEALDKMPDDKFKPLISNPSQLRDKWGSIKELPKVKQITTI